MTVGVFGEWMTVKVWGEWPSQSKGYPPRRAPESFSARAKAGSRARALGLGWLRLLPSLWLIVRLAGLLIRRYWIELHFRMPEKANPKWAWPSSDGDIDKLVRATLDGLVGGRLLLDDRHITKLYAEKEFAPLVRCGVDVLIL